MPKRHTQKEIQDILKEHDCELLSEYKNNTTKLKIKCKCGNVFYKSFAIMNKSKKFMCNECVNKIVRDKQKIPYEILKEKIENVGYKLLTPKEEYTRASDKCKIQCNKGHIYYQIPLDLFNGHKCKKCASRINGDKYKLKIEDVIEFVESRGFERLSDEYKSADTPIKIRCKKCNHIFYPTIHNLKNGSGCPKCYDKVRGKKNIISYEERLKYVRSFDFDILTPKEEYIDGENIVTLKCNKGHIYETKLHYFYNGNRCPICRKSKGESRISKFLKDNNIEYFEQYRFDDCKFKNKLPFDFYIPSLNLCIEYDGKQHYEINGFKNNSRTLVDIKIRDTVKNIYCKNNNIKLLRIPYRKFNDIENILTKEILNYNKHDETSTTIP